MEKYLPIIYVRGYAGTQEAVESTVDKPYYGFNLGSTQVRTGPDGDPDFFIFESPLARLAVGPGSDGLVQMDHAYVKGSSRAFVYRSHSGPLGIVNSEEGYQNLQRFLFGVTSVVIDLEHVRLKDSLRDNDDLRFLLIETTVLIRGERGHST